MTIRRLGRVALLALCLTWPLGGGARGAEATVAVAANFAEVMEALVSKYEVATGHFLTIASGSTGKLYAQIHQGAPFDVLLAADQERPRLLVAQDIGVASSRFTYAIGRLTLWSPDPGLVYGPEILQSGGFNFLAIANPDLAPYGLAARQTLQSLDLWQAMEGRLARGENAGQTFAMVASGSADLGFVALSHANSPRNTEPGSQWNVPPNHHDPIRQDAVLLARGMRNPAAVALIDFLKTDEARAVIASFGYGTE